jgi:hypothetical protein
MPLPCFFKLLNYGLYVGMYVHAMVRQLAIVLLLKAPDVPSALFKLLPPLMRHPTLARPEASQGEARTTAGSKPSLRMNSTAWSQVNTSTTR